MTLGELQEVFAEKQAKWVLWALEQPGVKLREVEGRILQSGPDGRGRMAREFGTDRAVRVIDAVHLNGGTHYSGVGKDWALFVDGVHITNGQHPMWIKLGEKWESMHPLARWGGRFSDANHTSMEWNGFK
jgi:hypothetical protein